MDAILELPTELPAADEPALRAVPAEVVHEWPVGTFVENLAVLADGALAVSVHTENQVQRLDPGGRADTLVELPVPPAGLVARRGGGVYVAGGEPGSPPGRVWRVEADGTAEVAVEVPGALFLNGLTPLDATSLLAADGIGWCLWRLDLTTGTARRWIVHERLAKVTSFPLMPGANGLKLHGGHAWVTNTDRAELLRIPVRPDGSAGDLEVVAERLRGDDLAFAADGTAYITTHIENSLIRVTPDGDRTAIAGPDQHMPGSTAAAFGSDRGWPTGLYVTTTGGLLRPYQGRARTAKLVRLQVAAPASPIPLID